MHKSNNTHSFLFLRHETKKHYMVAAFSLEECMLIIEDTKDKEISLRFGFKNISMIFFTFDVVISLHVNENSHVKINTHACEREVEELPHKQIILGHNNVLQI